MTIAPVSRPVSPLRRIAARLLAAAAWPAAAPPPTAFAAAGQPAAPGPGETAVFLGRQPRHDSLAGLDATYGGRTVLVTGAGGSIGAVLCRHLLTLRPRRLLLLDLSEYALYRVERGLAPLAAALGVDLVPLLGSVGNRALLDRLLVQHGVEVVLHAAAYKHVPLVEANPLAGLANNVLGTEVLARAAQAAGVARFVLVSSDKAVRPGNVMGASKRLAEIAVQDLAARSRATRFAIVRFGNVLGSSGSVLPLFQDQVARGGPVTVTGLDVTRFFMLADEAAALVLRAGALAGTVEPAGAPGGAVFLLDMGAPVRIGDLARQVIAAAGRTVCDAAQPEGEIAIVEIGLRPGEKRHEELLIGAAARPAGPPGLFVATEAFPSELEVAGLLRDLREAVADEAPQRALALAERWVEGFAAARAGRAAAASPPRRAVLAP